MKNSVFNAVIAVLLLSIFCPATPGFAAAKFGLVYDISGTAEIVSPLGKSTQLVRAKHLLMPVRVGDRIKTHANSWVMVVAQATKTGYNILPNTEARIESSGIKAEHGEVKTAGGYAVPTGQSSGPMGAVVLRGRDHEQCITPLKPVNTSITTLTPELAWSVACKDINKVSVRIVENRKVIYETTTESSMVKIPADLLTYGRTYAWIIDAGRTTAGAESDFSIPSEAQAASIRERIAMHDPAEKDLVKRVSYLFFLMDSDLRTNARAELDSLQREFPDNDYLKDL